MPEPLRDLLPEFPKPATPDARAIAALPDLLNAYEAAREMVEWLLSDPDTASPHPDDYLPEGRRVWCRAIAERHGLPAHGGGGDDGS